MAKEEYIKRHDRACAQLHFNIRKEIGAKLDNEHCYEHVPELVETSYEGEVNILWNEQVQIDRTIPDNKPDIIIRENEKRNMYVNRCCNFKGQKCDQERSRKDNKI